MLVLVLIPAIYPHSPASFELRIFVSIREGLPAGSPTHERLAVHRSERVYRQPSCVSR
jgi:hypothetical protein